MNLNNIGGGGGGENDGGKMATPPSSSAAIAASNSTAGLLSAPQRKLSSLVAYDDVAQGDAGVTVCLICGMAREEAVVLRCQHIFCHGCLKTRGRLLGELRVNDQQPTHQQHQQPAEQSKAEVLSPALSSVVTTRMVTLEMISLSCPVCGERTPLVSADGEGVDALTSVSMQGLRLDRKMSLVCEAAAQRCDVCCFRPTQRGPVDADYYCSRCAMNFCTQCKASHDTQPVFRSHGIIHISNKDSLRLYCERHARLHCLYFCQDCQLPACCACLLVEHPSHATSKLREALTLRRDNLKTLLNELGPLMDKSEARLKRLVLQLQQQQQLLQLQGFRQRTHSAGSTGPSLVAAATVAVAASHASNGVTASGPVRHKSEAISPRVHLLQLPGSKSQGDSFGHHASNGSTSHPVTEGSKEVKEKEKESSTSFFKSLKSVAVGRQKSNAHQHPPATELAPLLDTSANNNHLTLWDGRGAGVGAGEKLRQRKGSGDVGRGSSEQATTGLAKESRSSTKASVQSDRSNSSSSADAKPLDLYAEYFDDVRQVFQLASNLLQLSQSKRLLLLYDDVTARLQMILKTEVRTVNEQLQARLDDVMATSESQHYQLQKHGSLTNSQGSLQGMQDRNSIADGSEVGDFAPDLTCQTMLVRPKLCWKEEKFRNEVGDLWNPCDVAFFSDGDIVVAEYDTLNERNNRLRMFASDGSYRGTIQQGAIKPLGVAVTREGNIAITDCNDKKVKIYSRSGEFVTDVGKGQFGWPYGIAVNSRGQLIVTDAFNDTVSIYASDGKRVHQLNKHFKNPFHVTVDNSDNIIVSDFGSNCLRVYDPFGQKIRTIAEIQRKTTQNESAAKATRRSSKYKLRGPRGVCTDFCDNILVADDCSRVCMFDSAGKYVRNLLTEEDLVKYPEAVATSSDGRLAVTEWNPNNMFAIKMFNLYE